MLNQISENLQKGKSKIVKQLVQKPSMLEFLLRKF